ncbi:MAG: TolC family protein [bacterium]
MFKRVNKFIIWFVVFFLPLGNSLSSQDNGFVILPVTQAIDSALEHHSLLKSFENKMDKETGLMSKPDFGVTSMEYSRGNLYGTGTGYSLDIRQTIPSPLKQARLAKKSKNELLLTRDLYNIKKKKVILEVKAAYYNWLFHYHKMNLAFELRSLFEDYTKINQLHFELGEIDILEKVTAETKYAEVEKNYRIAMSDFMIAENELKSTSFIKSDIIPGDQYELPLYKINMEKDSTLFPGNLINQYYEHLQMLKEDEVRIAQASYFPDIFAGFFTRGINQDNGFNGWHAGISISLFSPKKNIEIAEIEKQSTKYELEHQKYLIKNEVENLILQLDKHFWEISYFNKANLEKAGILAKTSQLKLEKEEIDYNEHVNNMEIVFKIKADYLEAINTYNQSAIKLEFFANTNDYE